VKHMGGRSDIEKEERRREGKKWGLQKKEREVVRQSRADPFPKDRGGGEFGGSGGSEYIGPGVQKTEGEGTPKRWYSKLGY